jgi:hypothetical protein
MKEMSCVFNEISCIAILVPIIWPKAGIVEPVEMAVARQRLDKQVPAWRDNGEVVGNGVSYAVRAEVI